MALPASLTLLKGKSKEPEAETAAETPAPAPAPTKGKITIGGKKAAAPTPTPAPEPVAETVAETPTTAEAETEEVHIEKMSSTELDKLVKDHDIGVPEGWAKMKVAEKRATLKAMFADPAEAAQEEAAQAAAQAEAKTASTAVTKTSKVGKTTSKTAAKAVAEGELSGPDAIADFAHMVENLAEPDALKLAIDLNSETDLTYFKLGGVLALIQTNGWFAPYTSFREYIEREHGLQYRTALYWVGIYNTLVEQKIPWEKVKALGWTKLKVICDVLDEENVDAWVEVAQKNTTVQLIDVVNNAKAEANKSGGGSVDAGTQSAVVVSTKTFKVHEDQKATIEEALKKAKAAANTDVDTVALEFICMDYLAGGTGKGGKQAKLPSLKEQLVAAGLDKAFEAVGQAYPDYDIAVTEIDTTKAA